MKPAMALYYLPSLIRSDRYYITRLEPGFREIPEFNFVISAEERVLSPLFTLEDPWQITLNQLAPTDKQDIPLHECTVTLRPTADGYELFICRTGKFSVESYHDEETGIGLSYSETQKRLSVGIYRHKAARLSVKLTITLSTGENDFYSTMLLFRIVEPQTCNRVVIDFGSEASQVGYKNGASHHQILQYDIMENILGHLKNQKAFEKAGREDFLNHEPGQQLLYRSFYAIKNSISEENRPGFPFNFTDDLASDEIRLFITRKEVAATEYFFRDQYSIIPNLKLGIEKSIQLRTGNQTEDYSILTHKEELISAILLRLLRLMISTKPGFRKGGMIVTLLVPNIYTQQDVFGLLNALRKHTPAMLSSLSLMEEELDIEFETISESDAAFMGFQQTHPGEVRLNNGEMALVIDSGKGTTDISMLLADENENYSSFFRTGFAGAGNVLMVGFIEDFLTLVLKAIPGNNDQSVKEFIRRQMLEQNMTADVLNFIQLMEDLKKGFSTRHPLSLEAFAALTENSPSTERSIYNLHRDPSTLLAYTATILQHRSVRWDETITGLIEMAADCIVKSIVTGVREVMTKDIRKRTRLVLLSGRAFYFEMLRTKLEKELRIVLQEDVPVRMLPSGRTLNNKNVAIFGAFSGAFKITDFTGMPVDRKEGLSGNKDVLNNNLFLCRGLKIEPGNDILYNNSVARRNHQVLKAFKNKTIDVYFTRDNIYLRMMENQRVKDVKSLYAVLTPVPESFSMAQDLRAISMFPNTAGELASLTDLHQDTQTKQDHPATHSVRRKKGILHFFQF